MVLLLLEEIILDSVFIIQTFSCTGQIPEMFHAHYVYRHFFLFLFWGAGTGKVGLIWSGVFVCFSFFGNFYFPAFYSDCSIHILFSLLVWKYTWSLKSLPESGMSVFLKNASAKSFVLLSTNASILLCKPFITHTVSDKAWLIL